jgi:hypothetical protein
VSEEQRLDEQTNSQKRKPKRMREKTTAGDQVGSPNKPNAMAKQLLLATAIERSRKWAAKMPFTFHPLDQGLLTPTIAQSAKR